LKISKFIRFKKMAARMYLSISETNLDFQKKLLVAMSCKQGYILMGCK